MDFSKFSLSKMSAANILYKHVQYILQKLDFKLVTYMHILVAEDGKK